MAEFLQWLSVIGMSTLKVIPALVMAMAYGMKHWQIFVGLFSGSMIGVGFFTFFGLRIIKWRKERRRRLGIVKPLNYRKARKYKRMWIRFGLPGIALLTPIFFGPAIGAVIAVIFERNQMRIFAYMGVSIAIWSAVFALLGHQVLELVH
ncbi:MAG: hypothetical protein RLZZ519_1041 [Bacteroidota bacterium]|jgi:hypothetical protein